jgi:transposase
VEEINQLKREGLSILAISNLTGYDRKTIRKYLLEPDARPVYGPRPAAAGKLGPFEAYLGERLKAGVWNARVLLRELRSRNYTGGYTILTDWLRPQREAAYGIAVRRFETPAGKHYGESGVMVREGSPVARALAGQRVWRHRALHNVGCRK